MKSEARQTLADFLRREIGDGAVRAWAVKNGLQEKEVQRAVGAVTGMTVDKLQLFADALGVHPWQLLFPGYERGAEQFPTMSFEAIDVARRIDAIKDEAQRRRLFAAVVNVLELATTPDTTGPKAAPDEPTPPAPDTTRKRAARL